MRKVLFFISVTLAFLFISCEKVVKLDLKNAGAGVVVQGNISSEPGPYTIKLNGTVNYYDSNVFPGISGAAVFLSDNAGNSETLHETIPGTYQTSSIQGVAGRNYYLKINVSDKEYVANSTMPYNVAIDTIVFIKGRNNTYRVSCIFSDPPGITNYYSLQIYSRDTAGTNSKTIRVLSDKLTDGQPMSITYRSNLLLNDTVKVNLQSIDKGVFDFYNTLQNAQGEINPFLSSPPANPISNISNGGLGYFSAFSVTTKTAVVR